LDQIETALKAAVQNEPLYLPARLLQVHLLRLRKKWAEANKLLDDLLKIDPHPLIEQTRNEVENYRLKRTQQDSAERQTRAHQNALNNVSNLYNNHYHGSVDWANIKRAIAGIPKEVVLNNQYYAMISGHVNMMTGNYTEAISDLNASLELYPNYHYATDILGKTYEAMGNIEKAVELYNSTIANNYHQYDTRLRRGILLCELGDIEGARTDIEFYKRYYPNNMETYEATAVLLAAEGDIKGALAQLMWCFTTFPSQIKPKHYLLRASLQKELNNPQEAFADLNHYIRLMPNDTNAQDLLQSWA
jgi:tetratricopeptide (TPR) repeat protein